MCDDKVLEIMYETNKNILDILNAMLHIENEKNELEEENKLLREKLNEKEHKKHLFFPILGQS